MLKDIRKVFIELDAIHCDNTSIVNMYKNPVLHSKTNHISIKYYMLRVLEIGNSGGGCDESVFYKILSPPRYY